MEQRLGVLMAHVRNYPVKCRSLVAKAVLAHGEFAKILGCFWNSLVEKFEDNPSGRFRINSNVKLSGID